MEKYLRLDDDMSLIYSHMSGDDYFNRAQKLYNGLHILRQDPWECLVTFICSANNNIPRIKSLVNSMAIHCGQRVIDQFGDFYAFPTPNEVFEFGEHGLRSIGLGFRAKYVVDAARKISDGSVNLCKLRDISYLEARERLMTINGVGGKIADCVLAFSLDKRESFPVDRHILRAMVRWYGISKSTTPEKVADWGRKKFGKHSSVANQYIFHRERLERRANLWGGKHTALVVNGDYV